MPTEKPDIITTSGNDLNDFDEAELEDLYSWIDGFSLERKKTNISRDFSDGGLVAAMIRYVLPQLQGIDPHTFHVQVHAVDKKKEQWKMLNQNAFSKLAFQLDNKLIEGLSTCQPGCIEKVLATLRLKLDRALWELKRNPPKQKAGGRKKESDKPESDQYIGSPRGKGKSLHNTDTYRGPDFANRIPKKNFVRSVAESDSVPRILFEEKEQECLAKEETIRILEAKQKRLEHLVHLKDIRIEDLQSRLESMRPTGHKR